MELNSTLALKLDGTGPWSMDVNSTTIVRGSLSYPYPLEIELYSENNTTSGEFFFGWTFDGATDFDCESTAFFGTIAVGSSDVDIHVSRCIGPCRGYM